MDKQLREEHKTAWRQATLAELIDLTCQATP